jgi:hypothetical protein
MGWFFSGNAGELGVQMLATPREGDGAGFYRRAALMVGRVSAHDEVRTLNIGPSNQMRQFFRPTRRRANSATSAVRLEAEADGSGTTIPGEESSA